MEASSEVKEQLLSSMAGEGQRCDGRGVVLATQEMGDGRALYIRPTCSI